MMWGLQCNDDAKFKLSYRFDDHRTCASIFCRCWQSVRHTSRTCIVTLQVLKTYPNDIPKYTKATHCPLHRILLLYFWLWPQTDDLPNYKRGLTACKLGSGPFLYHAKSLVLKNKSNQTLLVVRKKGRRRSFLSVESV